MRLDSKTSPVVRDLADLRGWLDYQLEALAGNRGDLERVLIGKLFTQKYSLSTAFSGIGAPEHAAECQRARLVERNSALLEELGASADDLHPRHLACVEWNEASRDELLTAPWAPGCMFVDANEFIEPKLRDQLLGEAAKKLSAKALFALLSRPGAVTEQACCVRHGRMCKWPRATLHVAGTPCVDWSRMPGAKKMGLQGKAQVPFIVWVVLRKICREPIICHENVESFDVGCLIDMLGDLYNIESVVMEFSELGYPIRRCRRITLLWLKSVTVHTPWSHEFVARCHRSCRISYLDLMIARPYELEAEYEWAATRKNIVQESDQRDADDVRGHIAMGYLTLTELKWYREYHRGWPNCAYMMSQDPIAMPNVSQVSVMQCQTCNQGMIFADARQPFA